jgi:hypothetical protein
VVHLVLMTQEPCDWLGAVVGGVPQVHGEVVT